MSIICFDLEGPLSPQDNGYEVMRLVPNGDKIFEVISRYDDLLTLEGKPGYEPGNTLALIVPFLIYHGISEADIKKISDKATLVEGAPELISKLYSKDWQVYVISSSYEQHAYNIGQKAGVKIRNIACTRLPLNQYRKAFTDIDFSIVERVEKEIINMHTLKDYEIKAKLDNFFWVELAQSKLGKMMSEIKVIGGQRKVEVLENIAQTNNTTLAKLVVIGDSITDFKMLRAVRNAGGLAIAFNANEYALPYATLGLASTNLIDLLPILDAWQISGMNAVEKITREKEKRGGKADRGYFHWLLNHANINKALKIHKRIRKLVKKEAAKLG